jgi:hypothetical protein
MAILQIILAVLAEVTERAMAAVVVEGEPHLLLIIPQTELTVAMVEIRLQ